MPRISNSPHRGNLSLISPACLTMLTGHREKFQSVRWLPWESAQLGKKKPSCQRNAPCTKARILLLHQGPSAQPLWDNADVCVPGFSVLQISMKDNKTVNWYFQITAQAADSFPVCGLSISSKVTLSFWRASHPHMTPSSSHNWEHLIYTWFRYAYMKSQKLY